MTPREIVVLTAAGLAVVASVALLCWVLRKWRLARRQGGGRR